MLHMHTHTHTQKTCITETIINTWVISVYKPVRRKFSDGKLNIISLKCVMPELGRGWYTSTMYLLEGLYTS